LINSPVYSVPFDPDLYNLVMLGLDPGIHVLTVLQQKRTWMAGLSIIKTRFALLSGHDE
jgi:hypothetical protein